jgi:gliding motility-associated-like protein
MKTFSRNIIILLLVSLSVSASGQGDEDPPESPVFTFITINEITGRTEMTWTAIPEPDLAGFAVYYYRNDEGYIIDTVFNPSATSFSFLNPYANERNESYVIAAFDISRNISPLSNNLSTLYTFPEIDTCNNKINIQWNKYSSIPIEVTGYDVLVSVNGGTYYLAGHVSDDVTTFTLESITNGARYCFKVKAILENGLSSVSNKPCVDVKTQKIPAWINADFATLTEAGEISLSFSIDPSSETDLYSLERRRGTSGSFQQIEQIKSALKILTYTDKTADPDIVNYYRISAINSCNIQAVSSNIASNIVLNAQNTGSDIILKWNQYQDWLGSVSGYRLFTDTGNGFTETAVLGPADTTFSISIPELMYGLKEGQACFYVAAAESGNPYGGNGESNSNQVCVEIKEVITVPNVFTPDGDLKNDLFRPVITFTPAEYRLLISNRQGKTLFESNDFMEAWDGTDMGKPVPEGVYLWFIRLRTPEGKSISRTGIVTVVKN